MNFYPDLLCPECKFELIKHANYFVCERCNHKYLIINGIIALLEDFSCSNFTSSEKELSILIPTKNESANIEILLCGVKNELSKLNIVNYEIIIVDDSTDNTKEIAKKQGAAVVVQTEKGYGNALKEGFKKSKGKYILTMDADFSHCPSFIKNLFENKNNADLLIASRYIKGGKMVSSLYRFYLSYISNRIFSFLLSLKIKDISGGFRLYKSKVLEEIKLESTGYEILEELIVKIYSQGYGILEVPFEYQPRKAGKSKMKLFKLALNFFINFIKMWYLRNSVNCCDYDERAYNSWIPLQRYWQRKRYKIIMNFLDKK